MENVLFRSAGVDLEAEAKKVQEAMQKEQAEKNPNDDIANRLA